MKNKKFYFSPKKKKNFFQSHCFENFVGVGDEVGDVHMLYFDICVGKKS